MTEPITIPINLLTGSRILTAGATAYPPLPVDPFEDRVVPSMSGPRPGPQPAPAQPSSPGAPAYPSLPTETDTREGGGGESR
jgi:hypothetical protein